MCNTLFFLQYKTVLKKLAQSLFLSIIAVCAASGSQGGNIVSGSSGIQQSGLNITSSDEKKVIRYVK